MPFIKFPTVFSSSSMLLISVGRGWVVKCEIMRVEYSSQSVARKIGWWGGEWRARERSIVVWTERWSEPCPSEVEQDVTQSEMSSEMKAKSRVVQVLWGAE